MPTETTVILLAAETLPQSLEKQLARRDVFVETATCADLARTVPVVVPELVVQSSRTELTVVLASLRSMAQAPPLVIIAERKDIGALRQKNHPEVQALIPADLPVAAIAHRISIMALRGAEGRPINKATVPPPSSGQDASANPHQQTPPPHTATSAAITPRPSFRIAADPSVLERSVEAKRKLEERRCLAEKHRVERENAAKVRVAKARALREEKRQQLATDKANRESKRPAMMESVGSVRPSPKPIMGAQARAEQEETDPSVEETLKITRGEPAAQELPNKTLSLGEITLRVQLPSDDGAKSKELNSSKPGKGVETQTPKEDILDNFPSSPQFDSVPQEAPLPNEEHSVVAALPVHMRELLSNPAPDFPPLRLALLDTDLTRADAVTAALRNAGVKIHPVTPDTMQTRWPLLRRFAPQGLIVDEKSMARGASEWVETFRGDLFLRHVPVILVRFSKLYREQDAQVNLAPLFHLIEPLANEEDALLKKLRPGKEVQLALDQIPPLRLVQLLTSEDRNTRLDCTSNAERLVWHLGPGYAGGAKSLLVGSEKVLAKLSPHEALSWLLQREDCTVKVQEHDEPLAHASQSEDALRLLHEMTEAFAPPKRHESVRPSSGVYRGAPTSSQAPSLYPRVSEAPAPVGYDDDALVKKVSVQQIWQERGKQVVVFCKKNAVRSRRLAQGTWARYQSSIASTVAPLKSHAPSAVVEILSGVLPIIIVVSLGSWALGGKADQLHAPTLETRGAAPEKTVSPAAETPSKQAGANTASLPNGEQEAPEDKMKPPAKNQVTLWRVTRDSHLKSCEKMLGEAAPKSGSPARAAGYWKSARLLLMKGKSSEAMEMMCLAGLYDPAGPAAEGLAEYYLGERSLKEAERWIKTSLKADSTRRKSQELYGDIESQKGNHTEALRIWLKTMHLDESDQRRRRITARRLSKEARLARKGGDLPRAERKQRRAVALTPKNAVAAADLADILLKRDVPQAAALWAEQALNIDPNYSGAMILAGRIAESLGKRDEARKFYERVPSGDHLHTQAQSRRSRL